MAIKKRITSIALSLAMLIPALPALPIAVQAAEEIPETHVKAARTWFSSQLNDQAKSIYDLLVEKFSGGAMDDGVTDIDLNEAGEVDAADVQAYLQGNRTLINDFTAAKDAFDLEHPEAWYIDCDYLSFRAANANDGLHAYVGIGRADSYLVQGMSADEVDVKAKTDAVNKIVEDIARQAENVSLPNGKTVTIKDKIEKAHDLIINKITYRFEDGIEYKLQYDDPTKYVEGVDYTDAEEAKHYIRTPFAMVSHAGVCESYSRAFQMVMNKMGIPCVLLHGVQTAGTPENHMWTAVQLPKPEAEGMSISAVSEYADDPDYAWYVCDLTWDDPMRYAWKWDPWKHEKIGYLPADIVNGSDGGENNTYLLVGNEIVGGSWELSPYFSTKDMAFEYPQIAPTSYTTNMLVDNPNGLSVKYAETGQMDNVKASVWEIRYKGMSLLQAHEKGYYFLCRMYSKHADGTMSQFDDWYYPEHMLYSLGDDPDNLTPHGNVHFHDTTAWPEAEDTKKYPEGQGALVMTFGQAEYIEFAITTKAPPEWQNAMDLFNLGGYYQGDGSDIIAETGMLYNKMGTYEAPPAILRQVPSPTAIIHANGGAVQHGSVEFNDRLYDPDAEDEDPEHEYDETSNYEAALNQALQIVPSYSNQMSQNPAYKNFKVTYACGATENLELDMEGGADISGEGEMNNGSNTPVYKFKPLKHPMNHTTSWGELTDCQCGVVKIEYDMTTSKMWFDDNKDYAFTLKGLIGRQSDKLPSSWSWGFAIPYCPICYRSQGIDWNLWGQPKLMDGVEDIDIEKMRLQGVNGEEETLAGLTEKMGGAQTFKDGRMALVVEDMSQSARQGELNDELDEKTDVNAEDVLSRLVYDINFARLCCMMVVNPGQSVRLQIGFPYGFDASSIKEGVVFSAYHFTRCSAQGEANGYGTDDNGHEIGKCPNVNKPGHKWGDDVLSVEKIPIEVTPYGLVLTVRSFSPFEILAVDADSPTGIALAEDETNTLVAEKEGDGTVTYEKDGQRVKAAGENGMIDIPAGSSVTFTLTPAEGEQIGSVKLFGDEIAGTDKITTNENGVSTVTVSGDNFNRDNPIFAVTFEAKAVEERNSALSVTAEVPDVCPHTNTVPVDLDGNEAEGAANKAPTCTEAGITYGRKCAECGQIVTAAQEIPATGHSFEVTEKGRDATCTEEGVTDKVKCSVCNHTAGGDVIPAKGHAYGEYETVANSATCQGTTMSAECASCGETVEKQVPDGAVAHNYVNYTDDGNATCTQDGTETAKCQWYEQCHQTDTRTVPGSATGHNTGSDGKCTECGYYACSSGHAHVKKLEAKAATCTESGLSEGEQCADCGTVIKEQAVILAKGHSFIKDPDVPDNDHAMICTVCGTKITQEHEPEAIPSQAATCTQDGWTGGTHCKNCGDIITPSTVIPALGHEWNTDAPEWKWNTADTVSATITFKCVRCDAEHVVNVPADDIDEKVIEAATCTSTGKSSFTATVNINTDKDGLTGALSYSGTNESGELTTPKLTHKFENYTKYSDETCTSNRIERASCSYGCGETNDREVENTKLEHDFVGMSITKQTACTEAGVNTYTCANGCSIVKRETIPAPGHKFVNGVCEHCGQQERSKTTFNVSSVEELRKILNDPDLDKGDTIVLAAGEYDLSEITDDTKIADGVMHVTQGITIKSASKGTAVVKGGISVETADVTIDGIKFTAPADIDGKTACIRNIDDGSCSNIAITNCTYEGTENGNEAFMIIEGARGVTMNGNSVKNADIVILPGTDVAMSGGIKINNNRLEAVKLLMASQAVSAEDPVDINDNTWFTNVVNNPSLADILGGDSMANAGYFALNTYTNPGSGKQFDTDVRTRIKFIPVNGKNEVGMYIFGYNNASDGSGETAAAGIKKLMSAKVKVAIDGGLKITGFTAEPTLGSWTYSSDGGVYTIHENGYDPSDAGSTGVTANDMDSAEGVRLGVFTIEGTGTGTITAEVENDGIHRRGIDGKVVKSKADSGSLKVAFSDVMRTLNLKLEFNNHIKTGNSADYNGFAVTVRGDGYERTAKVGDGGESGVDYDSNYNGQVSDFTFENLPAPGRYTVTVTGAGYRTFTKEIDVTDDSEDDISMTVWNDVKDNAQTVITSGAADSERVDVTFLAGDTAADYVINYNDLNAVIARFGKTGMTVSDAADIKYDLNRDGVIDSKDIAMVLLAIGK